MRVVVISLWCCVICAGCVRTNHSVIVPDYAPLVSESGHGANLLAQGDFETDLSNRGRADPWFAAIFTPTQYPPLVIDRTTAAVGKASASIARRKHSTTPAAWSPRENDAAARKL